MTNKIAVNLKLNIVRALEKIGHYGYYINVIILVLVGLWLYVFLNQYYWKVKEDVRFIQENIHNVTYVDLNIKGSEEIYESYEQKRKKNSDILNDLNEPF